MGYYSGFDYSINKGTRVDLEKKEKLEEFFSSNNSEVFGFFGVKIYVENDEMLGIDLDDFYSKFYDSELFRDKLKDILISGSVELSFTGEDGEKWGFLITPGNSEELCFLTIPESKYEKIKHLL